MLCFKLLSLWFTILNLSLCWSLENGMNFNSSISAYFSNGVNLQPSYYNGGNVNFGWSLMKSYTKIKTVRIEIEPGYESQAVNWVKQARDNGYFVVATYHDYTKLGSDDANVVLTAGKWWQANYKTITQGNSNNFIVNLINEWGSHSLSSKDYASAYNSGIAYVRTVYSGPIILDCSGWGQEIQIVAMASSSITDKNIIFSAHIYPAAWNGYKNRYVNADDLTDLQNTGRPCLIGEFGTISSGNADVTSIVTRAKQLGWSVLGWAWNGDGGEMNMVTPSWSTNPTATSFSANSKYFDVIYNLL